MKNIHIIPTDKPSRLYEDVDNDLQLGYDFTIRQGMLQNQNIYITSDKEIKRIDYWLNIDNNTISNGEMFELANDAPSCKKIILTTDKSLDGVQEIDDEFLEWFVDNQTCEQIEVVYEPKNYLDVKEGWEYTILIPKQQDEYCHYSGLPSPAAYVEKPIAVQCGGNMSFAASTVIVVGSGLPPAKLTLELTQKEARGLLNCLIRTHANGTDLDVGETIEEKLLEFLKPLEK